MEFTRNEKRAIVQCISSAANENQINRLLPQLLSNLEINSSNEMEDLWDIPVTEVEMMQILRFDNSPEKRRIFESLMDIIS